MASYNWPPQGGSSATGTVTSVALSDASTTAIYGVTGSPVTTSGTLTLTLKTEAALLAFMGPTSGSAAQPSFRAIAANDLPVIIGTSAGAAITSGTDNTFLGISAGAGDTSGSDNTFIGYQAGIAVTTGHDNTLIGFQTVANPTTQYATVVGSGSSVGTNGLGVCVGAVSVCGGYASVCVGSQASCNGDYSVSIGGQTSGGGKGAIAIGTSANAGGNYSMMLGQAHDNGVGSCWGVGATTDQAGQIVVNAAGQISFGTAGADSVPLTDLWIGRGAIGDGTASPVSQNPSPIAAGNADTAGASHSLNGGISTGSGAGGPVLFKTSPAGSSGSTQNALATVGQVTSAGAWTLGATSTTPQHVINSATGTPVTTATPAGYMQFTINGTTHFIPYFT